MGDNKRFFRSVRFRWWVIAAVVVLVPASFLAHVALFNRWYLSPGTAADTGLSYGSLIDGMWTSD